MITRFGLLKRNPEMSPAEFDAYWKDVHGPMAADLPKLRAYYHQTIVERGGHAIQGDWPIDGFSELHFDNVDDMQAAFATQSGAEAKEDLSAFLDDVRLVACEKHVVIPFQPTDGPMVKRMSLIKRKPEVTEEQFRHEWLDVHAKMLMQWPGVIGYNQNVVVDRFYESNTESTAYEQVPADGIVEIWFPSPEQAEKTHATQIVAETMAHARDFLSEITPFLVTSRTIV